MKYLKTYESKGSVYLNEERQIEIIQAYADCFIELSDLGASINVRNYGLENINVYDNENIKEVVSELGLSYGTDTIEFMVEAYSSNDPKYHTFAADRVSPQSLRSIYEHLKYNLKDDELRLADMANVDVKNVYTRVVVDVKDNRTVHRHPSIISYSYTGNIYTMTDYTIDPTNKPKTGIIRRIKSFMYGNNYNFPDIHPGDEISQISMLHYLKGLK